MARRYKAYHIKQMLSHQASDYPQQDTPDSLATLRARLFNPTLSPIQRHQIREQIQQLTA